MTPALETPKSHDPENFPPMFRVDETTGKMWQRKGLLPYDQSAVSKSTKWEYEPVVGDPGIPEKYHHYLEYTYWSILAFRLTPYSTMGITLKNEVGAWMSKLPWYLQLLNGLWKLAVLAVEATSKNKT